MKYYFIVPAAGLGKRMGLDIPKQYYKIRKKPIFIRTLEVIDRCDSVDGIYVAVNKEDVSLVEDYIEDFNIKKVKKIIIGGSERQYSIYNALCEIEDEAIIAVQDGVRPNIKDDYIIEPYKILMEDKNLDGVVVGTSLKDTVKIIDKDGFIIDTPKRSTLFAAHTPQIFKSTVLKKAYKKAMDDNFLGTDDSSLVERIGGKIKIFEGLSDNIKITTKEDLKFFE
ncbi:MAG: 2-C-methyl-D-erythritol 4-phosphate cytidylyltransferase [Sebaldella sp.]|nr:2-C-methyl-D-erythritol 4-phosphate cytidylyltransferase [Sebaldella sp.]